MTIVPFFEFINIPITFFKVLGQVILESPDGANKRRAIFFQLILYFSCVNYLTQWGLEVVFIIISLRSLAFDDVYAVAPFVGCGLVGFFKLMTLHLNKSQIEAVLKEFQEIYPKTLQLQKDYHLKKHLRTLKPVMKFYAGLNLLNAAYCPFVPIFLSIRAVVFQGVSFDYPQAFPTWYPFEPSINWGLYVLTYMLLVHAGFLAASTYLTADLFLVSSLSQLCMHFDYISKELEEFKPSSSDQLNDQFLEKIVKHHVKCLELNVSLDKIFGFSLLLNFVASSGTICFVGFQVTSSTFDDLLQNIVLFMYSLIQVLIVCLYGNKLIDASQAVGDAAFGHPWFMCNLKYRKMIVLIIGRSQKFAAIHAPTFPPISLETFMKVVSMAYQFFAVLETTSTRK